MHASESYIGCVFSLPCQLHQQVGQVSQVMISVLNLRLSLSLHVSCLAPGFPWVFPIGGIDNVSGFATQSVSVCQRTVGIGAQGVCPLCHAIWMKSLPGCVCQVGTVKTLCTDLRGLSPAERRGPTAYACMPLPAQARLHCQRGTSVTSSPLLIPPILHAVADHPV